MISQIDNLRNITLAILDESRPANSCRADVMNLKSLFDSVGGLSVAQNISTGETATGGGVAISPTMAAMCLDDFARTVQFIRDICAAIVDQLAKNADRPVRVLFNSTVGTHCSESGGRTLERYSHGRDTESVGRMCKDEAGIICGGNVLVIRSELRASR